MSCWDPFIACYSIWVLFKEHVSVVYNCALLSQYFQNGQNMLLYSTLFWPMSNQVRKICGTIFFFNFCFRCWSRSVQKQYHNLLIFYLGRNFSVHFWLYCLFASNPSVWYLHFVCFHTFLKFSATEVQDLLSPGMLKLKFEFQGCMNLGNIRVQISQTTNDKSRWNTWTNGNKILSTNFFYALA